MLQLDELHKQLLEGNIQAFRDEVHVSQFEVEINELFEICKGRKGRHIGCILLREDSHS